MLLGRDVRACIAYSETDNQVENIVKDALENEKVVELGPVICSSCINAEQRCGCPGGRPQTDSSQTLAESNDEVGKTVDSHCGTPC